MKRVFASTAILAAMSAPLCAQPAAPIVKAAAPAPMVYKVPVPKPRAPTCSVKEELKRLELRID